MEPAYLITNWKHEAKIERVWLIDDKKTVISYKDMDNNYYRCLKNGVHTTVVRSEEEVREFLTSFQLKVIEKYENKIKEAKNKIQEISSLNLS